MTGQGKERTAKLCIKVGRNDFDSSYIFSSLFPNRRKSKDIDYGGIARDLFIQAAREKGLNSAYWKATCAKYNLTQSEYYGILTKMRDGGLLRKSGSIYYVSKERAVHLRKMASNLYDLFIEQGIE